MYNLHVAHKVDPTLGIHNQLFTSYERLGLRFEMAGLWGQRLYREQGTIWEHTRNGDRLVTFALPDFRGNE